MMKAMQTPPHRPFRLIGHLVAGAVVFFVLWVPLVFVTGGFQMGPAEELRFSSLDEAQQKAFSNHGAAFPGSQVEARTTSTGYVIERRWLWWTEVSLPLDAELSTNTARYELGLGNTVQQIIVTVVALIASALTFVGLRRRARPDPM